MNTDTPTPKPPHSEPADASDAPTSNMLGMVQEHSVAFVDGLIEFGRDQIVMVKTDVTFANGTTLSFCRDDFAEFIFTDEEDE